MNASQIWDIPGGIHPPEHKALSNATAIQPAPLPKRLVLPLNQHIGAPAEPVVALGERVLKGQLIAAANGFVSVPVHAPTSGTISFIGPQPYPHVSGMLAGGASDPQPQGPTRHLRLRPLRARPGEAGGADRVGTAGGDDHRR
jgi:hypothetical protein